MSQYPSLCKRPDRSLSIVRRIEEPPRHVAQSPDNIHPCFPSPNEHRTPSRYPQIFHLQRTITVRICYQRAHASLTRPINRELVLNVTTFTPQRGSLPAGLATGVAGSLIGDMLFGATNSSAQTTDADVPAPEANNTTGDFSSAGILLILLLVAALTVFYFLKIQRPSLPDFSGITGRDPSNDNLPTKRSATTRQKLSVDSVTSTDKADFQQLLIDIQKAWSTQDLTELRQLVTPEMLNYFSAALADNTSQDIQNHVEDVVLLRAEILEVWTEQAKQYVTAGLRWSARDYNLSLTKQHGEPGYLVEGSEEIPTESGEAWTFMRIQEGKWRLSAIQQ